MKKNYRGILLTGLFGLLIMGMLGCNNSGFNLNQKMSYADPNLALNKPISASTADGNNQPRNAVDGDQASYWSAANSSPQWIAVDLSQETSVSQIKIKWSSTDYPTTYEVLSSLNNNNWTKITEVTSDGDIDTITFDTIRTRFLKINCIEGNGKYYSLYEYEVYSGGVPVPTVTPNPTTIPSAVPSIVPSPSAIPSPMPTGMKDFTLKDLNDQNVTLSSFLGKKILLNFSGSHCGPCISEFPVLQQLQDKKLEDVVILVVCQGNSLAEVKNLLGKYTFKTLYTTSWEAFDLYNVEGTPTNIFLNRQGQEVKRKLGFGGETVDYYIDILNKIQ